MFIFNRKEKYVIMMVLIMCTIICYYFVNRLHGNFQTVQFSEERCSVNLEQAKHQLAVVSDYKNRIEKLLTDSRKSYDNERGRFRDIMENCVAMKQQCNFCQTQFEDLQSECKAVREKLDKLHKELEAFKTGIR